MTTKTYTIKLMENEEGFWLAVTGSDRIISSDVTATPAAALLSLVQRLGLEGSGAKVLTEEEVEAVLERGRKRAVIDRDGTELVKPAALNREEEIERIIRNLG